MDRFKGQMDLLPNADGSAMITDNLTKTQILASVFGPVNLPESKQLHNKMVIDVLFVKENQPDIFNSNELDFDVGQFALNENVSLNAAKTDRNLELEEAEDAEGEAKPDLYKNLANTLTTSNPTNLEEINLEQRIKHLIIEIVDLNQAPRACLKVHVQVLQNRGNILSCSLNCVVMALLDSGISMKTTPITIEYNANEAEFISQKISESQNSEDLEDDEGVSIKRPKLEAEDEIFDLPENCSFAFVFDKEDNYKNVLQSYVNGDFSRKNYDQAKEKARSLIDSSGLRGLYLQTLKMKLGIE